MDGAEEGDWTTNWDNGGRACGEGVGSQMDHQGPLLVIDIRYGSRISGDVGSEVASYHGVERSYYCIVRYVQSCHSGDYKDTTKF